MNEKQRGEAIERIAQIDRDLESATGWGSWMVMAANEREALVDRLRADGVMVEHQYQARLAASARVD